jgi:hypothetical protein
VGRVKGTEIIHLKDLELKKKKMGYYIQYTIIFNARNCKNEHVFRGGLAIVAMRQMPRPFF